MASASSARQHQWRGLRGGADRPTGGGLGRALRYLGGQWRTAAVAYTALVVAAVYG